MLNFLILLQSSVTRTRILAASQYSSGIQGHTATRINIPPSSSATLESTDARAANTPEHAATEKPTIILTPTIIT